MTSKNDSTVVAFQRPAATDVKRTPRPDWDRLEVYYRAGYSLRNLATLPEADGCSFKTIHKHAKKYGWTVDLSKEIQQRARQQLIAGDEPLPEDPDELQETIVKRAVDVHVNVAKRQQQRLDKLARAFAYLANKVEDAIDADGIIDVNITGGRDTLTDVIKKMTSIHVQLQEAERYVHNLDAQKEEITPVLPMIGRRSVPVAQEKKDE